MCGLCFGSGCVVQLNGRGRGNGNVQVYNLVDAATGGVGGQLTVKLELAVAAGGGQGTASLVATEPYGVALGLSSQRLQRFVVSQSVVRG